MRNLTWISESVSLVFLIDLVWQCSDWATKEQISKYGVYAPHFYPQPTDIIDVDL